MDSQQELTRARNSRFLELLHPVHSDCERWAYSLVNNQADAEDILSQAVMTGLIRIHQLKNDDAFKTWMFKIIRSTHLLWLRSNKRVPEPMAPEDLGREGPRDDEWSERTDRAGTVRLLLEKLAPEQRQALVLFEMQGLSIRETGQVLGKQESTIRVLLHRARQRFRELLEKEGIRPDGKKK